MNPAELDAIRDILRRFHALTPMAGERQLIATADALLAEVDRLRQESERLRGLLKRCRPLLKYGPQDRVVDRLRLLQHMIDEIDSALARGAGEK